MALDLIYDPNNGSALSGELDLTFDAGAKPKKNSALRGIADLGLGFAGGAVGATKAIADAAGAGNVVSETLDTANKGITGYLSDSAKADQQTQSAIMKEAEGKGTLEGVKAGFKAFTVAPAQTAVTGLGSVVPVVAGIAATAATGGGAAVPIVTGTGIGAAMGAGTVKGAIFDEIKKRGIDSGMSEADAIAAATKAQEYGGENAGNIGAGAVLGMADAATGVTAAAGKMVRNAIIKPVATEAATAATRGIAARTALGIAGEMPLEAAQGGQEKYAANVAAQRAGYQADAWDGVASQATLEALASAGPGGLFGAMSGSKYVESKRTETPSAEEKPGIAGLLPAPTYTGTPGDQMLQAEAERQAAIDAADANAAAVYAARDAFEKQLRQSVTIINEPAPLQQRIDEMLNIDAGQMTKVERADYDKALVAAFSEPIGIRHDENQKEIPFTMGEYLDAQAAADDAVRSRPLKQNAAQQADARLSQLATEEETQQPDIAPAPSAPVIPVVGALSAVANMAVQSGAHATAVAQQAAVTQAKAKPVSATAPGPLSEVASAVAPNIEANTNAEKPAQVAAQAPQANAPQAGAATLKGSPAEEFIKTRTDGQLTWLSEKGTGDNKALAQAEIQRRQGGVQIPNGDGVTSAPTDSIAATPKIDNMASAIERVAELSAQSIDAVREAVDSITMSHGVSAASRALAKSLVKLEAEHAKVQSNQELIKNASPSAATGYDSETAQDQGAIKNQSEQPLDMVATVGAGKQPKTNAAVQASPANASATPSRAKPLEKWTLEELVDRKSRGGLSDESAARIDQAIAPLQRAKDEKEARAAKFKAARNAFAEKRNAFSIGPSIKDAEPVSVVNGVVHIGGLPAVDYDTEADITVPDGASKLQIISALRKGGAISSGSKVFGANDKAEDGPEEPEQSAVATAPKTRLKPMADPRIGKYADDLRSMSKDAGWAEVGGKLLIGADGKKTRTKWLPGAEWFLAGMINSPVEVLAAVNKAANNEPMSANEKRTISGMMDYLDRVNEGVDHGNADADVLADAGYDEQSKQFHDVVNLLGDFDFDTQVAAQDESAAMRSLGFTEDDINELTQGKPGNSEGSNEDAAGATGKGSEKSLSDRNEASQGKYREEGESALELAGQTNTQAAAEFKRQQEEAAKKDEAPASPTVKADQVDLFNTQDSLFNSNRDASPVVKKEPVTFVREGDYWNYYGNRADEIAKAIGVATMKKNGKPIVGFPDYAKDLMRDDLQAAGFDAAFEGVTDGTEKPAETKADEGVDRNSYSVTRFNNESQQLDTESFARGEYVRIASVDAGAKGKESFGEIEGISHKNKEAKIGAVWYSFGQIYKAEKPEKYEQPKVSIDSVIDTINKKYSEGITDADRVPRQYNTMADIDSVIESIYDGTVSIEDYKAAFNGLIANKEAIVSEFGKMTIPQLHERFGKQPYGRPEKKGEIIERAFEAVRNTFSLRRDYGRNSYGMGRGEYEKYVADNLKALTELVNSSTDEDLKKFADEIGQTRAARQEKIEAAQDPKTIEDFNNALRLKKSEGMSFAEARMSLTPEQRAEYDRLKGIESRDQRKARADQQKTDVRVASQTTDGQIVETKHTKTGEPLFVVKSAERVERDVYNLWNATAKRIGGYYSSFRGNGAVPGFQFKTRENADAFLAFIGGNADAAKEVVQERRDSFADDRSQSAVERLNEMADRLEERADESLGRERKANTERRARFAASAESAANAEKAMAKTMRRIAGAISDGTAKFLDRVRQKAQIEYLAATLRTAKGIELRTKYPSYADQQRHEGETATGETADYAEYPQYAMMRSDLANLARKMISLPNMKMLGQRILKVADDTSDAYNAFAKEHLLEVSKFGKADGSGWATFSTLKDAERSIDVSNLMAVAVPLQIKRGEYRIVLSPSEAINRGIWKGDDRKMYLSTDIGSEIVEKMGRLNRKHGQRRGMDAPPAAPWQFENAYNNLKRLAGMGIEQPWEFRAALREFADLKEAPKEADKIKAMERAMIGRKNDGLDFFPTPAETAQAMIDAAEITEGMSVLEPSAGMGHIAEKIRDAGVSPDVIEFSGDRRELLEAKGFNVVGTDFMEAGDKYDRIIMNPPFSNRRDAEHVQHAYTLLKPGGRLVAIMGEGVFFGQDKKAVAFREWLDEVGGTSEKLESGTFLDPSLPVNTATNARMVVIEKPEGVTAPVDSTDKGVALLSPSLGRVDANKVDVAVARQVVTGLLSGWSNAPDSSVVATFDDLPAMVRKEVADQGEKTARGVFHGGTFYLIADEHASAAEIEETIFHEVWAHYGLRSMFGANTTRELADVFDMVSSSGIMGVKGKDAFRAFARRNGFETAQTESMLRKAEVFDPRFTDAMKKRILVEELIAKVQEKGDNPSLKRKAQEIIGAIREWLRKVGFSGLMKYSDADLMRLVQKARDTVKYGKRGSSGKGDAPSVLMTAWHGSPHDHNKFDSSKIGSGEGAQAYGHGLYFASSKSVAEYYRSTLSNPSSPSKDIAFIDGIRLQTYLEGLDWITNPTTRLKVRVAIANSKTIQEAIDSEKGLATKGRDEVLRVLEGIKSKRFEKSEDENGRLYQVELAPSEDEYLDWDKPLSEQSENVQSALRNSEVFKSRNGKFLAESADGQELYNHAAVLFSSDKQAGDEKGDKAASDYLHSIGIRGIRYLDGSSRSAGDGSSNYVIFSDDDVSITAKYNIAAPSNISPADKAIYGMAAEGKSAAEILKFVATASRNPFNRQLAKLLLKTGIAPSVTVGDAKGWKFNAGEGNKYAAAYNPKTDTVALFRPGAAERNVMHELVHAATLKALSGKGMAAAQMNALYQHVKKTGKLKGMYGMSDIDEFIAEAFTNPKFQDALRKIAAPQMGSKLPSAWHWFVRIVKGILGLPDNQLDALSQALEIGVGVMREDKALRKADNLPETAGIAARNDFVNHAIEQWADGTLKSGVILDLGKPSGILKRFGVPDLPINMTQRVLIKSVREKHDVEVGDLKDIVVNIQAPIAVFKSKNDGKIVVVAEARHADGNIVVALDLDVTRDSISINDVRSIYPKRDSSVAQWIADGLLLGADKHKGRDWLENSAGSNSQQPQVNAALDKSILYDGRLIRKATESAVIRYNEETNRTTASEGSDAIRYNVADEGWSITEPSKMDDVIYSLQDKQIDMRRVMQSIMKTGKQVKDDMNAYLQEELFHGRAAKGVKDFLDFELRPMLKQMQDAKVDMGDFEEYLWNRHAEERNKQIAKINPEMQDGGSGIETADARAYLAGLTADQRRTFEALAVKVDAMNKASQKVLVESGLEKQETIDAWNGAYKNYVPLQREDVDNGHVGTGKGFSVRGSSSKRAMGSGKNVVDIIANITMQRERNIVRAEKNRVSNAVLGLAVSNPNPEFWKVDQAPKERVVEEKAIYTVLDKDGNKLGEFTRMDDADRLASKTPGATIDQTWGDRVEERVMPGFKSRDNVLLTRINGEDHYVIFNERDERAMRMAGALKNLDVDNMGKVLSIVGKATRYLASINTQYNPVFGVINLIRDTQGALINLSSTPLAGEQKRVLGYTKDALVGIYKDIRDHRAGRKPSSKWAALFEEFQKEGGQTGYRDQYANAEARAESIISELAQFKEGKAKQLARGIFGWLSDYNETMENAVRLAVYKTAKEKGVSNQQAASLAKNATVNFNRKGQVATQIGALYAFFNASVQGTARMAETLFDIKDGDIRTAKLSKAGKKIMVGGIMLGAMQALLLAAAGFGDDEPPEFIRERNLILPTGDGKYLTLAMPLGFHVIPGIGRIATEFVLGGGKDPLKHLAAFASMFAESFNPVGSAGFSLQTITPSVVDPFAALAENKDFTGKEIYRKDFNPLNPTPGHARAKDVATVWSRYISEALNFITGGTEFKPGMFSPSPDAIDYLIGQVTGGVGREASKVAQTYSATTSGEDLPLHKIPLVGRFVGDTAGQSGESKKFYDAIKQINMHEAEFKGLMKDGRKQEAQEYMAENPATRLMMAGNHTESAVRKLRGMKRDLVEQDADKDQIRAIDDRITATMRSFNERAAPLI